MASPLSVERLYRQTLYDISEYVRYYYATENQDLPGAIVNTLQDFEDLHAQPYLQRTFRVAAQQGAQLMADHSLSLGNDDKERTHILSELADLGFFLEDDIVHADFVV
jgi:hypothetical protein